MSKEKQVVININSLVNHLVIVVTNEDAATEKVEQAVTQALINAVVSANKINFTKDVEEILLRTLKAAQQSTL
jgi:hypothetical protein